MAIYKDEANYSEERSCLYKAARDAGHTKAKSAYEKLNYK